MTTQSDSCDRPDVRIVVATDFSPEAETAENEALRLGLLLGGELVLVHVAVEAPSEDDTVVPAEDLTRVYAAQARWAELRLSERALALREAGVEARWRRCVGAPHEEIVRVAEAEQASYIVMGTHGRGGFERVMLGSVADRVVRTATCPVLTVAPPPRRTLKRLFGWRPSAALKAAGRPSWGSRHRPRPSGGRGAVEGVVDGGRVRAVDRALARDEARDVSDEPDRPPRRI